MCFSIPRKVISVQNDTALIDTNEIVTLGAEITVKPGEYLQVLGNVAVGKLSPQEGLKIRRLIKQLNSHHE